MNDCLDAAIKYATKYGWAVFPIRPETKRPYTPRGCLDAKKDVGAIRHWWRKWPDASVGVATGSISGLVVVDEDVNNDTGIDGIKSIRLWEKDHGEFPETATAITGRGGSHLYFHYEGNDIRNRAGLLEGVDVRGEGGYVVAPPSIHPNGTVYQWEFDPDDYKPAELNQSVLDLLRMNDSEEGATFELPERIPAGQRNTTLFKLACSLQAQGLPDDAIRSAVMDSNRNLCDPPVPDDEVETITQSALNYKKGELKIIDFEKQRDPKIVYMVDKNGEITDKPAQTIANAEEAIGYDRDLFGRIHYNELAYVPYVYGSLPWKQHKGWREWTNADDSYLRSYIESKYGLKNGEKTMDALANVANRHPINPIKNLLEECHDRWDGGKHIENLLPKMLGAEKNDYTIAVMRLFMLGAISRIYRPGCKFDYMLVLVGEQGGGKSSFLRFLALDDSWYNDNFSTLDSARSVENLRGMWIVELAELQATKRAKDVETIKSFITSRVDTYRAPYNRRTEQRPRMCVLAGTSNPVDFLTDKTGNRRFLPVTCNIDAATFDIFADELETKSEIAQAWGEAMEIYTRANGSPRLVLPKRLQEKALEAQAGYLEEDPYIGMIQEYLDTHDVDRVCVVMLWREALGHTLDDPPRRMVNALHDIMRNNITGWRYVGQQRLEGYGRQRCYARTMTEIFEPISAEIVPFEKMGQDDDKNDDARSRIK